MKKLTKFPNDKLRRRYEEALFDYEYFSKRKDSAYDYLLQLIIKIEKMLEDEE